MSLSSFADKQLLVVIVASSLGLLQVCCGLDQLTVQASYRNSSGGGAWVRASETRSVAVTAMNDAPVVSVPSLTVPKNGAVALRGVNVSDADAGETAGALLKVTIDATANGTLHCLSNRLLVAWLAVWLPIVLHTAL